MGYGFSGDYLPPRTTWPPNPLAYGDSLQTARLGQVGWLQSVRDVGMQYDNTYDNRIDFSTGGPVTDNVKVFIALRQNKSHTKIPVATPDLDQQLMSSLVYKPTVSDKYKLTWNYNRSSETYFSSSYRYWLFDPNLSTSQRLSNSSHYGFDWNHIFSQATFGHVRLNMLQIKNQELIALLDEGQFTADYSLEANWRDLTGPSAHRVGRLFDDGGEDVTTTYSAQGNVTSQINNSNMIKIGSQFSYFEVDVDRFQNRTGESDIRLLEFEVNPWEGSLFTQDKMEFEGMIANMGLRMDFYQLNTDYYSDIYAPLRNPGYDPDLPYLDRGPYYSQDLAAKSESKLYTKLQPRIGVSFPVDETTVFHLNYGTFSQRPNFNQLFYNQITWNKDGVVNPERNAYDKIPGSTMSEAVRALTLMYYYTNDEKYAQKAISLLRTWFLDDETKMHPHLDYGQFVPGRSTGRSLGIIESRNFVFLTDYEKILQSSPYWTLEDHREFKQWMRDFLAWLLTSELGQEEQRRTNNHGSWCDYQLLALSQYCDQPEIGKSILSNFYETRLEEQIDEKGRQPEELTRTKSFNYSVFNLDALINIMTLAENYSRVDDHHEEISATLKAAIDFVLPYALGEKEWEYKQITGIDGSSEKMIYLVKYAYATWGDTRYAQALQSLVAKYPESIHILTVKIETPMSAHKYEQR